MSTREEREAEQDAQMLERLRAMRDLQPNAAFVLVSLPADALQGDEQREAVEAAVVAMFAALSAVAR